MVNNKSDKYFRSFAFRIYNYLKNRSDVDWCVEDLHGLAEFLKRECDNTDDCIK